MRRSRTAAAAVTMVCAVLVAGPAAVAAQASPAARAPVRAGQQAGGPGAAGDRTFGATRVTGATRSTLRLVLDAAPAGRPQGLPPALRRQIALLVGAPISAAPAAGPEGRRSAAPRGPAVLRCDRNPSWSDARGTLHARFNCHHHVVNWGYRISRKVQSVITGRVVEAGVSWWRNGRAQPRNAGHTVGADYLFHGTLKPVHHGDHVQFQDHMTFRVVIGGRTGTGSLTWAADTKAKK